MKKKLGFIGCGNMAKAMISGIVAAKIIAAEDIICSDINHITLEKTKEDLGICISDNNIEIAQNCEIMVLAVKPQFYQAVIKEIAPVIGQDTIVITIAPGQSLEKLAKSFAKDTKIILTMPNTPALVCEGMTAICPNNLVTQGELNYIYRLLSSFGKVELVSEYMINAVIAVSGSSPAYVYMMIEAMADGAVMEGMPRDLAYKFAAQAVFGSAKMVMETGIHPGKLKDMVCSPAGTTIEAVSVLEEKGFRGSIIKAMTACAKKSKALSQ